MIMLHKIYIYRDKENLPEEGWFQSCFMCYTITSNLKLFDTFKKNKEIYEIYVYVCPPCKKKMETKVNYRETFKQKCIRYINRHFFTYP